ncbi:MAG: SulP family inorganic anion transporter [Planctomycetota bacterium]
MQLEKQNEDFGRFSVRDILASIVVFLVALPLCMGVAIASGAPVATGLITGIVGGVIVGIMAGSPLQVSGPAAGLTVVVYELIEKFGVELLGVIVLLAGGLQVLAAFFRLGQWFRAVSPAVIKGMLAGIGILIFASQFHVMVDDKPKGSGLKNLLAIPGAIQKALRPSKWHESDIRRQEIASLKKMGELHRRQLALREHISKEVPQFSNANPDPPEQTPPADLAQLVNEQKAITEEFARVANEILATEAAAKDDDKLEVMRTDIENFRQQLQGATANLEKWDVRQLVATQNRAAAGLEKLLADDSNHMFAGLLGLLTIITIILWQRLPFPKLKLVPAPLIAVTLATVIASQFLTPVLFVEVPNRLWDEVFLPQPALLESVDWVALIQAAILVACIASAETLLCATAVDQLHSGPRTKYDKELFAQGVGNAICGVLGALPLTGVIVRSSANVQAGGGSRWSAVLHGIWILVFVAFFSQLLRMIPTSSLAAILVYTGYKLVDLKSIKKLKDAGWGELLVFLVTVVTIVLTDLLTGVLIGVGLSAGRLLYHFSDLKPHLQLSPDGKSARLNLEGSATFVKLPLLASTLESLPPSTELHIDLERLKSIDHACLDLIANWARQHEKTGGKLSLDWERLKSRTTS